MFGLVTAIAIFGGGFFLIRDYKEAKKEYLQNKKQENANRHN